MSEVCSANKHSPSKERALGRNIIIYIIPARCGGQESQRALFFSVYIYLSLNCHHRCIVSTVILVPRPFSRRVLTASVDSCAEIRMEIEPLEWRKQFWQSLEEGAGN